MNVTKLLLALLVLVLAVLGGYALVGLVAWLFKYIVLLGVVLLVGAVAYKALKGGGEREPYQLSDHESDLARTDRLLEELRRKQLTK